MVRVEVFANELYAWALNEKERVESLRWEEVLPKHIDKLNVVIGGDGTLYHYFRAGVLKGPTILVGHERSRRKHLSAGFSEAELMKVLSLPLVPLHAVKAEFPKHEVMALADVYVKERSHGVLRITLPFEEVFADGMVFASPFGSTAYNKSVGGPRIPLTEPLMSVSAISPIDCFQPFVAKSLAVRVEAKFKGEVVWFSDGKEVASSREASLSLVESGVEWFLNESFS